jgi:hypothetical protein
VALDEVGEGGVLKVFLLALHLRDKILQQLDALVPRVPDLVDRGRSVGLYLGIGKKGSWERKV